MVTPLKLQKSRRINFALGRWAIRGLTAVYGSLKSPLVDPLPLFQSEAAFFGWQLFEKPIKDLTISAEDFLANNIRDQLEDGGRVNEHRDDCHQARWLGSVGLRSFQVNFILIRFFIFLFSLCPTTYCHKSEVFTVISYIRTRLPGTFSTIPKLGRSSQELQSLGSRSSSSTASTTPA